MNDNLTKRILLIEDDGLLRWSVEQYLSERGFEVDAVENSAQALSRCASGKYDVLITDLRLPGMDGLALAARVREENQNCQVVIVTGDGSKDSVIKALRQGVLDYLEKPVNLERLHLVVEKAVEKARMQRELVRLSRTDGLTGLYNLRFFYEVLEKEIRRAHRQGHPLSLLLVDVDLFKEFNDRHGHLQGDEVLVKVARALIDVCRRDVDTPFRYGGDEFMIILPDADLETAGRVSERVHLLVRRLGLESISLSIGLAQLFGKQGVKEFIRQADEAMYLAKQMGGDRSVVFSA